MALTPESQKALMDILKVKQPQSIAAPLSPYEAIQADRGLLSTDPVIANLQKFGRGVQSLLEPETPMDYLMSGLGPAKAIQSVRAGLLATKAKPVDTSYRMQHQARGLEPDAIRLDDLTKDISGNTAGYPSDFYSPKGQRIYSPGPRFKDDEYGIANQQSYNIITKVKNKPDAEVTIYRAVPKGIKNINEGDFVTLSPKYAEIHASSGYGKSGDEAGQVISQKVKVKDLIWDANDVNEFGYFPTGQ